MPIEPHAVIYFDGGAAPNPGPIIIALVCGKDHLLLRLARINGGNNEAEFRAAEAALEHAAANGMRRPTIAGDSDAVIAAMGGRRPPRQGRLTQLYEACVAKDEAIGGAIWQRLARDNPAGLLICTERRIGKATRRRARHQAASSITDD